MYRILHVIGAMDCGGAEAMLMNLYRKIDRRKFQFDFVVNAREPGFYDKEIRALGGRIYRVPRFQVLNYFTYARWWNKFLKEHPEYKIIHGHINSSGAIYLSCAKRHGRIAAVHSHSTGSREKTLQAVAFRIFSYPIRYIADYFFGCSMQAGQNRFGKKVADSDKFQVLKNGIAVQEYRFDDRTRKHMRETYGVSENTVVVGHVGRFTFAKNHKFLIKVFAEFHKKYPNSELWLIGGGELEGEIRKQIGQCHFEKNTVQFIGRTDRVSDYLQAMDVFVFPSFFEGLGMALIEAQAAGLFCVASQHIPKEADIGAGLVRRLKLEDSVSCWADAMLQAVGKELKSSETAAMLQTAGKELKSFETAAMFQAAEKELENSEADVMSHTGGKERKAAYRYVVDAGYGIEETVQQLQDCYLRLLSNHSCIKEKNRPWFIKGRKKAKGKRADSMHTNMLDSEQSGRGKLKPSYIIRLDDACPTMDPKNWARMERLLEYYNIRPIVGVIPDNRDSDFHWKEDPGFWDKMRSWQEKGWELSLHGLHHKYHFHEPKGYFQLSHGINTEFAGVSLAGQKKMLEKGSSILAEHGLQVRSFFAPAHTYDRNTVKALSEMENMKFISDGYGLCPYRKAGMIFLPSICDGPFRMLFGTYTFVFHPSVMGEKDFKRLERFLRANHENVITAEECLKHVSKSQGAAGRLLEILIFEIRDIRKKAKRRGTR